MGLIREPKEVDFTVKSEPWTEEELLDFRKLIAELKAKDKSNCFAVKYRNSLPSATKKRVLA